MSTLFPPNPGEAEEDPLERQIEEAGYTEEGVAGLTTDWSVPWSDLMMRPIPDAFRTPAAPSDTRTAPASSEPAFEPAAPSVWRGRAGTSSRP